MPPWGPSSSPAQHGGQELPKLAAKAPPRPEGPCSPRRGGQDGSEEALTVIAHLTHPTGLCDSEHLSLCLAYAPSATISLPPHRWKDILGFAVDWMACVLLSEGATCLTERGDKAFSLTSCASFLLLALPRSPQAAPPPPSSVIEVWFSF